MRFTTTIELGGKTATGFGVPDEIVERLGQGSVRRSRSRWAGTPSSTVAVMDGRFLLPLSAENREAAGVVATRSRSTSSSTSSHGWSRRPAIGHRGRCES